MERYPRYPRRKGEIRGWKTEVPRVRDHIGSNSVAGYGRSTAFHALGNRTLYSRQRRFTLLRPHDDDDRGSILYRELRLVFSTELIAISPLDSGYFILERFIRMVLNRSMGEQIQFFAMCLGLFRKQIKLVKGINKQTLRG